MRTGYPPVFLTTGRSSFLDDLIGKPIADSLRSIVGYPVTPRSPFGMTCGGDDSYLTSAFSSSVALVVFVIALVAGLLMLRRQRLGRWLVTLCLVVPMIDTGIRAYVDLGRAAAQPGGEEFRAAIMANLPVQMMANALFLLGLPFATGLALVLLVRGCRHLINALVAKPT